MGGWVGGSGSKKFFLLDQKNSFFAKKIFFEPRKKIFDPRFFLILATWACYFSCGFSTQGGGSKKFFLGSKKFFLCTTASASAKKEFF